MFFKHKRVKRRWYVIWSVPWNYIRQHCMSSWRRWTWYSSEIKVEHSTFHSVIKHPHSFLSIYPSYQTISLCDRIVFWICHLCYYYKYILIFQLYLHIYIFFLYTVAHIQFNPNIHISLSHFVCLLHWWYLFVWIMYFF